MKPSTNFSAAIGVAGFLALGVPALADSFGTPEEARAMLERAVAAVKADKEGALAAFTAGEEGFRDRDLYVFCAGVDGITTAHGADAGRVGTSLRETKDAVGEPLGEKIYAAAEPDKINTVRYMFPRPGEREPAEKVSYVTQVGDQVCGVGYYQP